MDTILAKAVMARCSLTIIILRISNKEKNRYRITQNDNLLILELITDN